MHIWQKFYWNNRYMDAHINASNNILKTLNNFINAEMQRNSLWHHDIYNNPKLVIHYR